MDGWGGNRLSMKLFLEMTFFFFLFWLFLDELVAVLGAWVVSTSRCVCIGWSGCMDGMEVDVRNTMDVMLHTRRIPHRHHPIFVHSLVHPIALKDSA